MLSWRYGSEAYNSTEHKEVPWSLSQSLDKCNADSEITLDLKRRVPQSHQAGHQERQASLRPQLLPSQRLPLELRCLSSCKCHYADTKTLALVLTVFFIIDMGRPQCSPPRNQSQRR